MGMYVGAYVCVLTKLACGKFVVAIVIIANLVLWLDSQHIQIGSPFTFQSA